MQISGRTRLAAVIGDPVRQSLSPQIHNRAFAEVGLDWRYMALPVAQGHAREAIQAMKILDLGGLSVTMPHKADVAHAVDHVTPAAEALESVNCVFWSDGELWGDSTDGDGLVRAIAEHVGSKQELAFDEKSVLVLGTGGAARSIVEALGRSSQASIVVAGRRANPTALAAKLALGATAVSLAEIKDIGHVDVVINATSLGMEGGPDPAASPFPIERLRPEHLVVDIVYQPRITPLLAAAAAVGAAVLPGVPMLVHQAALAFTRWTGVQAPLEAMVDAVSGQHG